VLNDLPALRPAPLSVPFAVSGVLVAPPLAVVIVAALPLVFAEPNNNHACITCPGWKPVSAHL
jgi:hypothetical protein